MKEDILKKATEMFLTLGFKSVTMDDIAAEMGISKKTIYQHFANKDELVEGVAMDLFENISHGIDSIRQMDLNPINEIFEIKNFMTGQLKNENASPFHQLRKYFPKISDTLKSNQYCKMEDCIKQNLQRGIANGLYRPEIDVDFITRIYYVGGSAIKDEDLFPRENFSIVDLTEKYLEYHLRAIVSLKGVEIMNQILNKSN